MINIFLGAALVAAPFFIKAGVRTTTVLSQEWFFALVTFLGLMLFGAKANHRIKVLGVMVFLIAFTAINPFGLFQYFQLMMSCAGVAFIALVYANRKSLNLDFLAKCFGLICLIESGWIILQYFNFDLHSEWIQFLSPSYKAIKLNGGELYGSLGNINHSGALIACTLPFLRPRYWIIPSIALYLGNSTMPVICAMVAVISLYSYRKEFYLPIINAGIVLLIAAIGLFNGLIHSASFFHDNGRVQVWKLMFQDVGYQFWGKGFGYISELFSRNVINEQRFYQAHNEWLELYVISGLLGVGVGIYLILPVFKNKGNSAINACLISLLVNSLGNFTFHLAPLFMIFGTCYALQLDKE